MSDAKILYFAYGEHWDAQALAMLHPGAESLGLARLENYDWGWAPPGRLSVAPRADHTIWGRLWLVAADSQGVLDQFHDVEGGRYLREARIIWCETGPRIPATLYAQPPGQAEAERVNAAYLDHVLAAARAAGLPTEAMARLTRRVEEKKVSR